jgi:formate hydrogenlyase subunit 3/multisubunit Na+/H+ antiporter MnhD subunit
LTVWALGLARMIERQDEDEISILKGAAHRSPLAAIAALIGMLSIAGFPLTAGFPSRWALLSTLTPSDPIAGGAILAGLFFIGAAVVRWASTLLSPSQVEVRWKPTFQEWFFIGGEAAVGMTQLLP